MWRFAWVLTACGFHGGATQLDGAIVPNGEAGSNASGFHKPITITAGADLADFVVSVVDVADADLAAHASAGAIGFTAMDGTVLPFEIVDYTADGSLEAWVRVTVSVAPTTIDLVYGGDKPPIGAVNPWTDHAGVWHMSGTTDEVDHSGHGNDVAADGTAPASVAGQVGAARSFDGVADALIEAGTPNGSLDVGTGSFSYEMWVSSTDDVGSYDTPFHHGGSSTGVHGYDLELGTSSWKAELVDDGGSLAFANFNTAEHGVWHFLAAVVDRGTTDIVLTSYLDGAVATSVVLGTHGSYTTTYPLHLGRETYHYHGLLDEVRVVKAARSAAWIAAEFANVAQRAQFVSIGSEQ